MAPHPEIANPAPEKGAFAAVAQDPEKVPMVASEEEKTKAYDEAQKSDEEAAKAQEAAQAEADKSDAPDVTFN